MMRDFPIAEALLTRRQQSGLHIGGQNQILLQRAALFAAKMIDAEADQWIGRQPVRLDRVVAVLADAKRASLDAFERGVYLVQQCSEMRVGAGVRENRSEFLAAIEELLAGVGGFQHNGFLHPNEMLRTAQRMLNPEGICSPIDD